MEIERVGFSGADANALRAHNRGVVLRFMWSRGPTSRADLVRDTGLGRTTVSAIATDLLECGIIVETGTGKSRGGRRPITIELVADARLLAGAELAESRVEVVLMDLFGQVVATGRGDTDAAGRPVEAMHAIADILAHCIDQTGFDRERVIGLGVGVAASLWAELRKPAARSHRPAWRDLDMISRMHGLVDMDVVAENDARMGVLAESWWGSPRLPADVTYVKMEEGVAAGHVVHGRVHLGHSGTAGEIGHVTVDPDGGRCHCGGRGCLETLVGSSALLLRYRELGGTELARLDELVGAATGGDAVAISVVDGAAGHLATALRHVISNLDPVTMYLDGPLTRAGAILIEPLRRELERTMSVDGPQVVDIRFSDPDRPTVAIGAATRVLELAFERDTLIAEVLADVDALGEDRRPAPEARASSIGAGDAIRVTGAA